MLFILMQIVCMRFIERRNKGMERSWTSSGNAECPKHTQHAHHAHTEKKKSAPLLMCYPLAKAISENWKREASPVCPRRAPCLSVFTFSHPGGCSRLSAWRFPSPAYQLSSQPGAIYLPRVVATYIVLYSPHPSAEWI